jgi:hypothetical protein
VRRPTVERVTETDEDAEVEVFILFPSAFRGAWRARTQERQADTGSLWGWGVLESFAMAPLTLACVFPVAGRAESIGTRVDTLATGTDELWVEVRQAHQTLR